jgi:ATP-dependent DNA helicase HFM1/MER3
MIFCFTRKSAIKTSKALAGLWTATNAADRLWPAPTRHIQVMDPELRRESSPAFTDIIPSNKFSPETTSASVAFHHAGLDLADRRAVEEGFLDGNIKIICSTSTLAVGVNLPCYLVIVKGTVSWAENGLQEYADLEMMQMLGRAGRPQFESSACAVILTRDKKIQRYQSMVSGNELLESSLHLNLVDHLNAEIGLGTVFDIPSARRWLGSTFLFVRLRRNPNHYKLNQNDNARCQDENEFLEQICDKGLRLLESIDLISGEGKLKCTEFGDAMARYCVKFETMKIILSLPPKAKISEIVSSPPNTL